MRILERSTGSAPRPRPKAADRLQRQHRAAPGRRCARGSSPSTVRTRRRGLPGLRARRLLRVVGSPPPGGSSPSPPVHRRAPRPSRAAQRRGRWWAATCRCSRHARHAVRRPRRRARSSSWRRSASPPTGSTACSRSSARRRLSRVAGWRSARSARRPTRGRRTLPSPRRCCGSGSDRLGVPVADGFPFGHVGRQLDPPARRARAAGRRRGHAGAAGAGGSGRMMEHISANLTNTCRAGGGGGRRGEGARAGPARLRRGRGLARGGGGGVQPVLFAVAPLPGGESGEPVPPPDAELEIAVDEWVRTGRRHGRRRERRLLRGRPETPLGPRGRRRGCGGSATCGALLRAARRAPTRSWTRTAGEWTTRRMLEELARAQWWTLSRLGASPLAEVPPRTLGRLDTAMALVVDRFTTLDARRTAAASWRSTGRRGRRARCCGV
jgi:hypothetical protein